MRRQIRDTYVSTALRPTAVTGSAASAKEQGGEAAAENAALLSMRDTGEEAVRAASTLHEIRHANARDQFPGVLLMG